MTQVQMIKNTLLENGSISRNYCLQNFISRLGAIIYILQREPYNLKITGKHQGGDYVYYLDDTQKSYIPKIEENLGRPIDYREAIKSNPQMYGNQ